MSWGYFKYIIYEEMQNENGFFVSESDVAENQSERGQ